MNGAHALIQTLADCGVTLCFANPGTSEMHLVQALDAEPRIRSVLGLFEGVCTGAADGYGRMTGRPALTLLHLGPGFANGIANLHNARKARAPIINLVGNHPRYHIGFDAPLTSDIDSLARHCSAWYLSDSTAATLARDGATAYTASLRQNPGSQGQIATLIIGADAAWSPAPGPVSPNPVPHRPRVDATAVADTVAALATGPRTAVLLEHHALDPAATELAGQIAAHTGCRLFTGTFPARFEGGPGTVCIEKLPYFPDQILSTLADVEHLVLVNAQAPVSFFAYPEVPSLLLPDTCQVHTLSRVEDDAVDALARVVDALGADKATPRRHTHQPVPRPAGPLSNANIIQAIAATLPEGAMVCTDSGGGNSAFPACQTAAPHTWLSLTGGSIGQGGPVATGAALACPGRRALALLGDGGAAYTLQCLWTQAREKLDVTTVIFANRAYNILNVEYRRLGVTEVGTVAASLFDIGTPPLSWVDLARGFGVPAAVAETSEALADLLEQSYRTPGPFLIEARGQMLR